MNEDDMEIAVSPSTFVALERALRSRVQYVVLEVTGQRPRYGIRLKPEFGRSTSVFPDGPGLSATDTIVSVLLGEFK